MNIFSPMSPFRANEEHSILNNRRPRRRWSAPLNYDEFRRKSNQPRIEIYLHRGKYCSPGSFSRSLSEINTHTVTDKV